MVKKRIVEREKNRQKLVKNYFLSRSDLKKEFKKSFYLEEKMEIQNKLQKFPRNRIPSRLCNRCRFSGRPRGYYRDFGLSRHFFRGLARSGFLPGIRKSSWLLS
jgi:small subunit ribosomal protein S14